MLHFKPVFSAAKVMVVDDHPVVRTGVCAMIESLENFEVVAIASNGSEAIDLIESTNPDIVVLDIAMPRLGGMETIAELKRRASVPEFIVFTLHQSDLLCARVLEAGARGYVCKSESDHLVPALEAVSRRETYVSPAVSDTISQQSNDEFWDRRPLTERERQIVRMVAEGHSTRDIARRLKISVKTAETHRAAAMRKTGSNTAAKLTLYAARNGIVDL